MTPIHGNAAITARQHLLQHILDTENITTALLQVPASLPRNHEGGAGSAAGKKKRVRHLIEKNCPARALRLIESDGCAPCTPEMLQSLFPARAASDDLPIQSPVHEPITITSDMVSEGLTKLPRLSAAGQSGWTYDAIRSLASKNNEVIQAITSIANKFLSGTAGPVEHWIRDRALGLLKPDGGTRPIVIGEPWTRLFHRLVNAAVAARAAAVLQPHQWGIGVKGGPETIAHACHIFRKLADDATVELAIQTLDIKNAYNTLRRSVIANAVNNRLPELSRWFNWAYATPSPLLAPDGTCMHMCGTGVKQGDPLASVLFCLGLHEALEAMHRRFPLCTILADMDDVTVLGPVDSMPEVVRTFGQDIARLGMTLNTVKCLRMDLHQSAEDTLDGLRIMGSYVGTDTYQLRKLTELFDGIQTTLDRIVTEEPAVALPLLKYCVNAKPVYAARTTRPDLFHSHADSFDQRVDHALLRIAGHSIATMPEVTATLRTLRVVDGGLGMHRIDGIKSAAYVSSLLASLTNLFTVMPATMQEWRSRNVFAALQEELAIISQLAPEWITRQSNNTLTIPSWPEQPQEVHLDPMLTPDAVEIPDVPSQRTLSLPTREQAKETITMALGQDRRATAWWRSGSYPKAASWTRITPIATLNLSAHEYRSALGLRLLLPARGTPDGTYLQCTICGAQDKVHDYRYHALNCRRTGDVRSQRHNAVKQALAEMLAALFGQAAVSVETPLGPHLRVPDITLTVGAQVRAIDVCVVNPTADRYDPPGPDAPPAGHAAAAAERRKRLSYAPSLAARNLAPEAFVPFAIEATGRFGGAAEAFLASLPLLDPAGAREGFSDIVDFHIARLRIITLRGNARAYCTYAPYLQTLRAPTAQAEATSAAQAPLLE
jgi:hypothetical protein